jgi:imidazolonepropionase
VLPAAAKEGLADAVDAFCERIAFDVSQTRRVFEKARTLGLPVKLHADQLSDSGGAALAASFRALSADHVEYSSEAGVEAMTREGTVAVLLPGAFYFLRETKLPPVEVFRKNGVPIALATDHNPGSSPVSSPLAILNMACTLFRLTPEEALAGMTRHAARALGLQASHGTLEPGKNADLALWEIGSPAELAYALGANPCVGRVRGGRTPRSTREAADGAVSQENR